mmetsp:Transcript_38243/g.113653  ORF Transcript_38243/g.113653 Transcript_38243/m.113653 type:complete len:548 (-) Transcript_38243:9-1652(-)
MPARSSAAEESCAQQESCAQPAAAADDDTRSLLAEGLRVGNITLPTALGNVAEYLPVCTGIALVGHLPGASTAADLDALALARCYFNIVCMAPGFGYISALRTVCPQAVGAGKPCSLHYQRALILIMVGFLPALPCLLWSEQVMVAAGQPPDLAARAAPYALRLAPSYFGVVGMSATQRIFQAHGYNWANLAITLAVCALAPGLQWLLVHRLGLGYLGAAWAQSLYNSLYPLAQVPYLVWRGHGRCFVPQPPSQLLRRSALVEHLKLVAAGFWMVVLEWWVCEAIVMLSGLLAHPVACIGASTVVANLQALGCMGWIGVAVAASTTVGQYVGAGSVHLARRAAALSLVIGCALAATAAASLVAGATPIAGLFTTDGAISDLTAALMPLLGGVVLVDAANNALGGVCSGLGLQRWSAAGQLVGYYLVGMPAGCALAFGAAHRAERGIFYLWGGVGLSMLTAAAVQATAILRLDWSVAARTAARRLAKDEDAAAVLPASEGGAAPAQEGGSSGTQRQDGVGGGGAGGACAPEPSSLAQRLLPAPRGAPP